MKRARADTFSGGTGDVSPQILTSSIVMTAANTYTEVVIPIPIARFQLRKGKSIVMEILRVLFDSGPKDNNFAAGGESSSIRQQLSTVSLTGILPNDPHVFAFYDKEYRGAFTAAGTFGLAVQEPFDVDLSDGGGHGYLVATDNVFFGMQTTAFAGASSGVVKIIYRFKEISIEEYIGIVQGQQ